MADAGGNFAAAINVWAYAAQGNVQIDHLHIDQRMGALASQFASQIQELIAQYLPRDASERIPFGGREEELAQLDNWLADPGACRLLLSGPAGRGKTALVLQWLDKLRRNPDARFNGPAVDGETWNAVFVPISIRVEMNRPEVFYQAMAARLGEILQTGVDAAPDTPRQSYYDRVVQLVTSAAANGTRLLVVIDGLDEALDLSFRVALFPEPLPANLKVLLTARWMQDDDGPSGWLRRLNWQNRRDVTLILPQLLNERAIVEAVVGAGLPEQNPAVIRKLLELSGGDPTLVRLYLDDMTGSSNAAPLRLEELEKIKPGFSGYFENRMEMERRAWRDERTTGAAIDEKALMQVLIVLVCAHGPLGRDELAEIVQRATGLDGGPNMNWLLRPLGRFLMGAGDGKGRGYVLNPPAIAGYLQEQYFNHTQLKEVRQRFSQWGRDVLSELRAHTRTPEETPKYLIQYLAQHWQDTAAPAADFQGLVTEGWLRAWEAFEHGYQGFGQDAQKAFARAGAERPAHQPWRSWQLRCQLVSSSIAKVGELIPGDLLLACAKHHLLDARQILHLLQYHSARSRAQTLGLAAPYLPEADREEALKQALEAARRINDLWTRVWTLATLAAQRPQESRAQLILEALQPVVRPEPSGFIELAENLLAMFLQILKLDPPFRAVDVCKSPLNALQAVAGCLRQADRTAVFGEILRNVKTVDDLETRLWGLAAVASHLPERQKTKVIEEALAAFDSVDDNNRILSLLVLAPVLPENERAPRVEAAVKQLIANPDADSQAQLVALAQYLGGALRADALRHAASAMKLELDGKTDPFEFANWILATHESDAADVFRKGLRQALAKPEDIESNGLALALMAGALPFTRRPEILQKELNSSLASADSLSRARVLTWLAPYLPQADCIAAMPGILAAVNLMINDSERANTLALIAPILPPALLDQALDAAKNINDEAPRARALLALALQYEAPDRGSLLEEARAVANQILYDPLRCEVLTDIAAQTPQTSEAWDAAVAAARKIEDIVARERGLARIASLLPASDQRAALLNDLLTAARMESPSALAWNAPTVLSQVAWPDGIELRTEALAAALQVENPTDRAQVLTNLWPYLAPAEQPKVLDEIHAAAKLIPHVANRSYALVRLANYVQESGRNLILREAVEAAKAIPDAASRVPALIFAVRYLPEDQRSDALTLAAESASTLEDLNSRTRALADIAAVSHADGRTGRLQVALEAIASVPLHDRPDMLIALASKLSPAEAATVRELALSTIREITAPYARANSLIEIGGHEREALEAVRTVEEAPTRALLVFRLLRRAPQSFPDEAIEIFLESAGRLERAKLLEYASDFLPVLARLEGVAGLQEFHSAVTETSKWFP